MIRGNRTHSNTSPHAVLWDYTPLENGDDGSLESDYIEQIKHSMKRELKFRAWTGQEMITPPSFTIGAGSSAEIIQLALDGRVSLSNAYGLDVLGANNPAFDANRDEITIMQLTGLKDKNGVDIYEGDIISSGLLKQINTVQFIEGSFAYVHEHHSTCARHFGIRQCTVIGNIYQNPELLIK